MFGVSRRVSPNGLYRSLTCQSFSIVDLSLSQNGLKFLSIREGSLVKKFFSSLGTKVTCLKKSVKSEEF